MNALILAGGRASPEMHALTGEEHRCLFRYRERTFIRYAVDSVAGLEGVGKIAAVGPVELLEHAGEGLHVHVPEQDSIFANLAAGMEALGAERDLLIMPSDNPILSGAAIEDFLRRAPEHADLAYPLLPHARFLDRFPHAQNIAVKTRDGVWIGGGCAFVRAEAIEQAKSAILKVLAARKSKPKLIRLLGPAFVIKFALGRVTVPEVERRAGKVAGLKFAFVHECDPAFAIDIDDPPDWEYLHQWQPPND